MGHRLYRMTFVQDCTQTPAHADPPVSNETRRSHLRLAQGLRRNNSWLTVYWYRHWRTSWGSVRSLLSARAACSLCLSQRCREGAPSPCNAPQMCCVYPWCHRPVRYLHILSANCRRAARPRRWRWWPLVRRAHVLRRDRSVPDLRLAHRNIPTLHDVRRMGSCSRVVISSAPSLSSALRMSHVAVARGSQPGQLLHYSSVWPWGGMLMAVQQMCNDPDCKQ